ncbi:MAG TPA: hypothetical protein VJG90_08885 [Candidatus Nanoarchaeia archaeon]|nr:hypothetical protein [Candidatus Nanoarchaeia archaeon]
MGIETHLDTDGTTYVLDLDLPGKGRISFVGGRQEDGTYDLAVNFQDYEWAHPPSWVEDLQMEEELSEQDFLAILRQPAYKLLEYVRRCIPALRAMDRDINYEI